MAYKALSKADAPKNYKNNEKRLDDNDFIVSKTDLKGKIIYCNQIFAKMAGYPASDMIGSNHNVIRHPDMPRAAFKLAWDLIQSGQEFFGFVKISEKMVDIIGYLPTLLLIMIAREIS